MPTSMMLLNARKEGWARVDSGTAGDRRNQDSTYKPMDRWLSILESGDAHCPNSSPQISELAALSTHFLFAFSLFAVIQ